MPFKGHAAKSCMPQAGLISLESLIVAYFKAVYHTEGTFKNAQMYGINHSLFLGRSRRKKPAITQCWGNLYGGILALGLPQLAMVASAGPKIHNQSITINESTWETQNILKETLNSHISFSSTCIVRYNLPYPRDGKAALFLWCSCHSSQPLQLFPLQISRFSPSQQMGLSEVLLKEETKQKV